MHIPCSVLSALVLFLLGCASSLPPAPTALHKIGEDPPLNALVERSVGDSIYETYNYEQVLAARLEELVVIDVLAASARLPPDTVLDHYKDGAVIAYCTRELALNVALSGVVSRVCLADFNRNKKFDSWKAPEGPPARRGWATLKSEVAFATEEVSSPTSKGFRYELVYQGISGNVLSLLYREYRDDFARPAFQQDLSYTLSVDTPTEVSFRSTRLRVHSADNNGIRYELLAGLNQARGER